MLIMDRGRSGGRSIGDSDVVLVRGVCARDDCLHIKKQGAVSNTHKPNRPTLKSFVLVSHVFFQTRSVLSLKAGLDLKLVIVAVGVYRGRVGS